MTDNPKENGSGQLAVRCRGVTKTFGVGGLATPALRGVDLEVYTGELTLLVGPSGCGKTTLLSIVAGILDDDAGEVEVFGHNLSQFDVDQKGVFRKSEIGFVFQSFNLLPTLNVMENAAIPLIIAGWPRQKACEEAKTVLQRVGLESKIKSRPTDLSGGQQQRVAIARSLVHNPRLLVCDEPTSALDHETGHAVMELLKEVAVTPHRAVIIVTHDPRVFDFGDVIAYMDDGKVMRRERRVNGQLVPAETNGLGNQEPKHHN